MEVIVVLCSKCNQQITDENFVSTKVKLRTSYMLPDKFIEIVKHKKCPQTPAEKEAGDAYARAMQGVSP